MYIYIYIYVYIYIYTYIRIYHLYIYIYIIPSNEVLFCGVASSRLKLPTLCTPLVLQVRVPTNTRMITCVMRDTIVCVCVFVRARENPSKSGTPQFIESFHIPTIRRTVEKGGPGREQLYIHICRYIYTSTLHTVDPLDSQTITANGHMEF